MRSSNACPVSRRGRRGQPERGLRAIAAFVALVALFTWVAGAAGPAHAESANEKATADTSPTANPEIAPPTLAALLAGFRTLPGFEARFEEEKTLALLAAPLRSRGRLYFAPPATLLRRVDAPNPHDILIREHVVRIATPRSGASDSLSDPAREVQTIDLARRADVRPLVESMLWIFSGDLAQLEATYQIDYQALAPSASGRWQLRLSPRSEPLSRLIRELAISGRGQVADGLEVTETSGDRTTTRILDANSQRRFAAGEIEKLFGIEAP